MKISKSTPKEGPSQALISHNGATHLSLSLVLYLDASPQSLNRHTGLHSSPALSSNAENFFTQTTHSAYPTGRLISLGSMYKAAGKPSAIMYTKTFLGFCGQCCVLGGLDQLTDLSFSDTHSQDPSSVASLLTSHT